MWRQFFKWPQWKLYFEWEKRENKMKITNVVIRNIVLEREELQEKGEQNL